MIERIQRRATKLIKGLRDMYYSECPSHTGLISMEKRRVRGDLIQVFEMLRSKDKIDFNNFLEIQSSNRTRGHNCSIVKHRSHLVIRKYFAKG